jgi:hypothetical protein
MDDPKTGGSPSPQTVAPQGPAHWWQGLPGILAAITALVGAITALVIAFRGPATKPDEQKPPPAAAAVQPPQARTIESVAQPPEKAPPPTAQTATAGNRGNAVNTAGSGNTVQIGR